MLPVMLDIKNKSVVVFGGGRVAERRVVKLLASKARVKVVSKKFTKNLRKMKAGNLKLIKKEINEGNIKDYIADSDIVLIATNDIELNDLIEEKSKEDRKLVNRADKVSDFIIPASLEIGDITIAISTKGKSPAVSKAIKNRIKKIIDKEDVLSMELQEFLREELKTQIKDQERRKRILRGVINRPEILRLIRKGDIEGAKREALKF